MCGWGLRSAKGARHPTWAVFRARSIFLRPCQSPPAACVQLGEKPREQRLDHPRQSPTYDWLSRRPAQQLASYRYRSRVHDSQNLDVPMSRRRGPHGAPRVVTIPVEVAGLPPEPRVLARLRFGGTAFPLAAGRCRYDASLTGSVGSPALGRRGHRGICRFHRRATTRHSRDSTRRRVESPSIRRTSIVRPKPRDALRPARSAHPTTGDRRPRPVRGRAALCVPFGFARYRAGDYRAALRRARLTWCHDEDLSPSCAPREHFRPM